MRGVVLIPAFNEELVIKEVLTKIPRNIGSHVLDILVINDGSDDRTEHIAKKSKVKVLTHAINRGLGAALGTGFQYARDKKYDFLVTLDADGQHDPREILKLLKPIERKMADFVVGSRVKKKRGNMPYHRKVLTSMASLATYFFTGVWTSDSQSGFRVFSKRAIELIKIEVDRMEVSTEFFAQCKKFNLVVVELPIRAIYTEYSMTKGQNFFNSFNILRSLLIRKLAR